MDRGLARKMKTRSKRGRPSGTGGKAGLAITNQFLDLLDQGMEPLWAARKVAADWQITESTVRRYRYRYEPAIVKAINEETDEICRQAARRVLSPHGIDFATWLDNHGQALVNALMSRGVAQDAAVDMKATLYAQLEAAFGRWYLDRINGR
jgi:hypothetical protein